MIDTTPISETVLLVGLTTREQDPVMTMEYLDELAFLVETAGGIPVKRFVQKLDYADPRTYVGSGKLHEIRSWIEDHPVDMVVFDDALSPGQIRNIEGALNTRIIDRNNLILDIFARRAKTSYARTQVELAQNEYLLPRLTRMWTHLEKQRGGIGLRGPGEQEIETDRRILRYRISLLKKKLKEIDQQKSTQRKHRREMIRVALVGYTNVGKSTIMNLLAKSDIPSENKLFATLDTTIRKVVIGDQPFLLSDTVGFLRKLPHSLIESFKSTLEEVREADLLIHVVDISHPGFEAQMEVVRETLQEINAQNKPVIILFNKIDAYRFNPPEKDDLSPPGRGNIPLKTLEKTWMARENNPCLFISAARKTNTEALRDLLYREVRKIYTNRYPGNQKTTTQDP
ncbi:MAG TPA: GTPase HflX [Bacteroidales bacterium]|nr:GTPase HflX [Bacteroidales bacterium]HPT09794.1 GTPase HflX [Bacteroidales bacterium]